MRRILITGSSGYIGEQLVRSLGARPEVERIVGIDRVPSRVTLAKFVPLVEDVGAPVDALLKRHAIDTVVHAAYPVRPRMARCARIVRCCARPDNCLRAPRIAAWRSFSFSARPRFTDFAAMRVSRSTSKMTR